MHLILPHQLCSRETRFEGSFFFSISLLPLILFYKPLVMATNCLYCIEMKYNGTETVQMFLDTSQVDTKWACATSTSCSNVVPLDSSLLNSLIVNPQVFFGNDVPEEWSRVFLMALYRGNELNDNKSIWYSTVNMTLFLIESMSVRTAAQNHIQSLHLRASKSKLVIGDRQQIGILPCYTEVVHFEQRRKCETMAKFLVMTEKVHNCVIKR